MLIEIDDGLRAQIASALHKMAIEHPRSIAAEILPDQFAAVVAGVCASIDLEFPGREAAMIVATAKWKLQNPAHFVRHRLRPGNPFSIWKKHA